MNKLFKNHTYQTPKYSSDFQFKHFKHSCIFILIEPINYRSGKEMIEIKKALLTFFEKRITLAQKSEMLASLE